MDRRVTPAELEIGSVGDEPHNAHEAGGRNGKQGCVRSQSARSRQPQQQTQLRDGNRRVEQENIAGRNLRKAKATVSPILTGPL